MPNNVYVVMIHTLFATGCMRNDGSKCNTKGKYTLKNIEFLVVNTKTHDVPTKTENILKDFLLFMQNSILQKLKERNLKLFSKNIV